MVHTKIDFLEFNFIIFFRMKFMAKINEEKSRLVLIFLSLTQKMNKLFSSAFSCLRVRYRMTQCFHGRSFLVRWFVDERGLPKILA